jgi:RNA polymerase sigma-B factor
VTETGAIRRADDTRVRIVVYRETGDRAVRDKILEEHRWLACYCANRFSGRGEPIDDLVQVAQLGLLKAIERYDPDYGVTFAGYAVPTMIGEIKRHFRDSTWTVRVSRRASDLLGTLAAAVETLSQALSRAPTVAELARHLHVAEEDVLAALDARQAYRMQSLTTPRDSDDGADRRLPSVEDVGLDPARVSMRIALTGLPEDDQRIVYLRFYEGLTQAEIAAHLGTSQVQVSRRLRRIYRRLEAGLEADRADSTAGQSWPSVEGNPCSR